MFLFYKKTGLIYISAFFLIIFDRFFKVWSFSLDNDFYIFSDFLVFTFAANKYIAFSLPLGGLFLIIFIIAAIAFLLVQYLYLLKNGERVITGALFFLILGAFSNLYDRLRFGYVIDYIYLKYFTVFNIADMMIVGAAIFIIFHQLKNQKRLR